MNQRVVITLENCLNPVVTPDVATHDLASSGYPNGKGAARLRHEHVTCHAKTGTAPRWGLHGESDLDSHAAVQR